VLQIRRLLSCAAVLVAALAFTSSALAASHRSHSRHVSGVVLAINAKQHTLKLRLKHAARHHAAAVRASAAGADNTIVVSFANATVRGSDGAVAIGDHVKVTCGPIGSATVASAIDVIGQPNGGDAGKGAAMPGTVTAVDSANGTLTLALGFGDSQDSHGSGDSQDSQGLGNSQDSPRSHDSQAQNSSVSVTVDATTILAVSDTNGDGHITLGDIAAGDHVVVFTADATADPIVAVGILDASQPGANHHDGDSSHSSGGSGDGGERTYQNLNGTVAALQPPNGLQVTVGGDGPLAGHTVTVDVTSSTHYKGVAGFSSIAVGDQVRVYTMSLSPSPIVAVFLGVGNSGTGSDSQPSSGQSTPPDATPTRFGGTVTNVRGDGLTVSVTSAGPLSGHSVIVAVPPSTTFVGVSSLSGVAVDDMVEIYTANAGGSPVVASKVSDDSTPSS
jgi:hypothetical protein